MCGEISLAFHSEVNSVVTPAQRGCVLLTGAHGFTGLYVRAELQAAGYRVVSACNHLATTPAAVPRVANTSDEITLDITSMDACREVVQALRPDYLIHLAAISFVQHVDAEAFYRVNVIGTLNLLQACVDAGVTPRRILIASSANVYGNAAEGKLLESQSPAPVNHYATSKVAMEYLVRTWCDRLPIVVTRPFNYTGIGQASQFLVPKIVSHFQQKVVDIELGNLEVERDFSDVRTVAKIYRRLLEVDCAGETVNVCSGRPYSLRSIIGMLEEIAGYEINVRINPAFVRANEVKTLLGSTEKLHRLVGDIDDIALPDTLRWMAQG
jgi:nucleoside-diphosphate-sugar epimerase